MARLQYNQDDVSRMAAEERRPSYNSAGEVRGFRSRPGAQQSPRDQQSGIGLPAAGADGFTDDTSWTSFFGKPAAASSSSTTSMTGAMNNEDWTEQPASSYLGNVISSATSFLNRNGVTPPPFSAPDRSMPAAPFMPQSPSTPFVVPQPLTGPMGNVGTDAAGLQQNQGIYAPGGASFFRSPASSSGWQSPTKNDVNNIAQRYGNTRLRYT